MSTRKFASASSLSIKPETRKMTETPSVLIACPMGHKLILPDKREFFTGVDWIRSVSAQDYVPAQIYALVNDLSDSMEESLQRACVDSGRYIELEYHDTGNAPDIRPQRRKYDREMKQERFTRFAHLRNLVLDHFLSGNWDYLVSIDSDVMVHPECVTKLVTLIQNKPGYGMVAGIVNNTRRQGMKLKFGRAIYNFGNITPHTTKPKVKPGRCATIRKFKRGAFLDVDYTGACAIIDGAMLRANPSIRWGARKGGEDLFFSERITEAGFKIGVDTTIVTLHQMDDVVYLEDRAAFQQGDFV